MAELWRELIRKEDATLAEELTLSRVEISRKTGAMLVRFSCARIVSERELNLLKRLMASAFPTVAVKVRMEYPALRDAVRKDISIASGLLKDLIRHESPASLPFIDWEGKGWSLDGDVLNLCVSSAEGASFLRSRGADRVLAEKFGELFGMRITANILVTGDDERRIREIGEARQREAELLAADASKPGREEGKKEAPAGVLFGRPIRDPAIEMRELREDSGRVVVRGEVADFELRDAKNGQTKIISFILCDQTSSVSCKLFLSSRRGGEEGRSIQAQAEALQAAMKPGAWVCVRGEYRYDDYGHGDMLLRVSDISAASKPVREDTAPEKRVELHLHTGFSTMDACASPTALIRRAAKWGHKAIAITDHGVVQAFPEAFSAAKKAKIKLIPGCEGYLIDDDAGIVSGGEELPLDVPYVVLDVETTGLNKYADRIIEIGAVRLENGEEVGEFSRLIDPGCPLPERVTELTGISSAMLRGQPRLQEVLPEFVRFCEGAVLVAHNAEFDISFFRRAYREAGLPFDCPVLDTLMLARNRYPQLRSHKLGTMCKYLGISLTNAHRAVHDARATGQMLLKILTELRAETDIRTLGELNTCFSRDAGKPSYHIILLAATQKGMENLYRLVSEAHLHHFYRSPRMPRSLIQKYREGLILGSACEAGELYRAVLDGSEESELLRIASFYDYLEIQPIGNNDFLLREGSLPDAEALRDINRRIVQLGEELHKPVCATGDVHFLEPNDGVFRAVLMNYKGFDHPDEQPPLWFRTTDEMLEEFSYLGEEQARRVVIDNPNAIAAQIGELHVFLPHPEGKETFQPYWPEAEGELRTLTMKRAHEIYGDKLPELVQKRIDKELNSIIGYGFSTLYMIAVKLVAKSLADGYIVGSRGSVGSSLVAFLSGITEVNSLPAHYVCPACKHVEFDVPEGYACGIDLPPKACPVCGQPMDRDGYNIPFEVFLGFKGDKVPDIDLNFSGEYQPRAHAYIKELFGADYCFRAGTIGTIAEKTAYGYVLKYCADQGHNLSNAEKQRLANGITGVKRTTGQHPAGMVVLPKEYSIYQFTPIQHPADDMDSDVITTHFDFSSMHDVLVKLDVLGHDDPTMLRKLQDLTGIAPQQVPLHDPEVFANILSLFSGTQALGITPEQLGVSRTGTLGVPEFGTKFVRGMLEDTRPTTMEELIRISGLSHGTDVWMGNAADLVKAGVPLRECICTRDDIMNALIALGAPELISFKTMESVRKGKGLTPEMEEAIRSVNAPAWYIDSCKKIKYMFPRAHAVAYVVMALRIAYFKIYCPTAYYCCYLQRNAVNFDGTRMATDDVESFRAMYEEIRALDKDALTATKEDEATLLEILIEMTLRGVYLKPIDIYRSAATEFVIDDDGRILPPISALPGVGAAAAEAFVVSRQDGPFISIDDMERRKVNRSTIDMLKQAGCLNDLPENSQLSLFDFVF